MSINITIPQHEEILKPRITVYGVGGAGGNAVNNMIRSNLEGVEFVVANTDSQALSQSLADRRIQLGLSITRGLGAGSQPDVGRAAAEENLEEIIGHLQGSNMAFVTAGMGGGTGSGAAPVIARVAREQGILTVGVVTKPFHFEGKRRMDIADQAIEELQKYVDTLIIIPNQNLFRVANENTTFAEAFKLADDVLHSGVRGVTDLMIMPGLINLDFADIRTVMSEMGKAMMGTGEAEGDNRAIDAAGAAISNPLLEDVTMKGARGVLINITGGMDMTLFEVDEAANRIRDEVDTNANIIFGSTFDEKLDGCMRVSVVATGIDVQEDKKPKPAIAEPRQQAAAQPQKIQVQGFATSPQPEPQQQPAAPSQTQAPSAFTMPNISSAASGASTEQAEQEQENTDKPFVPTPAMNREDFSANQETTAEPFASAALENANTNVEDETEEQPVASADEEEPRKSPSLFERITSSGRKSKQTEKKQPQLEEEQPEFGNFDSSAERIADNDDDHDESLDIPAFLRRQVN